MATKIDIISGFLGAGKTTLIKKLLKEAYADEQVVLIETNLVRLVLTVVPEGSGNPDPGNEFRMYLLFISGRFRHFSERGCGQISSGQNPDRAIRCW